MRIGTSGWRYAGWRGVFYPPKLPQRRELEYLASQFDTVELNGSFYSLQTPESYRAWREATPPGFVFALKGSRFITHMKKLRDVEIPLANFFASGVLALGEKLGPILWQFPETFRWEPGRLDAFFALLPKDTREAARLARKHDARLDGRCVVRASDARPLRHAVEVRNESFRRPEFVSLLRAHGIALVVADTAGRWPRIEDVTADFVYVRLHGDAELYASGYTPEAIAVWAERVRTFRRGGVPDDTLRASPNPPPRRSARDVYVYFDNDRKVRAPFDALALAETLRGSMLDGEWSRRSGFSSRSPSSGG